MTESTGFGPDPERNRAEWLAAHPGAGEVDPGQAAAQVAAQLGDSAPGAGVSDADLGAQLAAAGAQAGLPHEDVMNALMAQVQKQQEQIGDLIRRDQQREQAAIAALGEPILQRYANGLRDKLAAHIAANPGGADHFGPQLATATKLADATANAISRGANDLGQVGSLVAQLDRFFNVGHARTAPGHLKHLDLGSAAYDLEKVAEEAARLAPGALALL